MKEHKFRTFCMLLNIYGLDENNTKEKDKIKEWLNRIGFIDGPSPFVQREISIVEDYFFNHKTYEGIAPDWNVTRERIRQIISKTMRKLKSKLNRELLLSYIYPDFKKMVEERSAKEKELRDIVFRISEFASIKIIEQPVHIYQKHIHDLELSIRAENALREKGVISVGELCDMTETELLSIRNFGRKCLDEVKNVLSNMNLYLSRNDM